MSFHRTKATLIGLLEFKRANEWVVTEKLGDAINNNNKSNSKPAPKKSKSIFRDRILLHELGFAVFLFVCGVYDYLHGKNHYYIYLFLQVITFTIAGVGWVGTIVPS
nr:glucomannan 4-beta-mannosyltransferase 2-like [Ipomoea batatas]GMD73608.1 glucomannan 4-beta-mannosyltransferase 2-like [Ipomoea batatas]GME02383.1 glucomannan 4-beta-mannosyltransferase 2-like [Ipomoea batatas]